MSLLAPVASARSRRLALVAAFAGLFLTRSVAPAASPIPVVGLVVSTNEPGHLAIRQAAQLESQRRQSLGFPPIRLVIRSGDGQWGSAADDAVRMVFDDAVSLVIAPPGGSFTHLLLQVAGRTQIPVISLNADASASGAGIPWMLRLVPSNFDQARRLLPLAARWTLVVPPERDGREIAKDLGEAARALGLTPSRVVVAAIDHADAQQAETLALHPDGILLWLPPQTAGQWAKAMRNRGFRGRLAGPCTLRAAAFVEAAGRAAEGFRIVRLEAMATPSAAAQSFARDYHRDFGTSPDELAYFGADAIGLAAAWLAGSKVATPRNLGLGITGPWQFSNAGDRIAALTMAEFRNGQWDRCDDSPPPSDNAQSGR
ncbi:MAG: ABC transporter substrate-binding protein [Verrucomicrobiales bacterium]|nr:ABC transporter substrate-binding protein [Verrucomicrobiales bacterium]